MVSEEKVVKFGNQNNKPSLWKHNLGVALGLSVVTMLFLTLLSLAAVVVRFAYDYVTASCG